jgi:hypothetical protein
VLGDIVLGELPLLFVPLEQDLLSLELDNAFQELYFVGPPSDLYLERRLLQHSFVGTSSHAAPKHKWPIPTAYRQGRQGQDSSRYALKITAGGSD